MLSVLATLMMTKTIDCPVCEGAQVIEYERPVIDWQHGGYIEGYHDDCEYCKGAGEVSYSCAETRLHHYKVKKGLTEPW